MHICYLAIAQFIISFLEMKFPIRSMVDSDTNKPLLSCFLWIDITLFPSYCFKHWFCGKSSKLCLESIKNLDKYTSDFIPFVFG